MQEPRRAKKLLKIGNKVEGLMPVKSTQTVSAGN